MENKKIANLLYPNAKPIEFWEQKYPQRNLSQNAEVTRFAPSPTGYLHIGHFFQCLCDMFIAKSTNGVFYFRVEDTDKKREVKDSIDVAIETLNQFGLSYDEGVLKGGKEKGNYGPYVQSQRIEIYNSFAKYLVENGKAYPCFCEKPENFAEVLEKRSEQLEESETLQEKDICRNLTFENVEENIKNNKKFALRLKSFGNAENIIKFCDVVKGGREIRENQKDIILIKSNGLPVYAFAHAVDDHLMRTTLVVRGEEWYPSVSSHLQLFDALNFQKVKYAHNPVICKLDENGNKRKVSKRKDKEADMRFFIQAGYPKTAILEYLLNLANSNFEIWRKQNPTTPLADFNFSAEKITSSNPMFDFDKLNDISKTIISKMTAKEVYENVLLFAKTFDNDFYQILLQNKDYTIQVFNIDRETPKPRKDIVKFEDVKTVWAFMFDELFEKKYELENTNVENMKEVLAEYAKIYQQTDTKEQWFDRIKEMSANLGYAADNKLFKQNPQNYKGNVALVCEYIRIAITGKKNSPDLYSICQVLGEKKTLERLKSFKV